MVLRLTQSHSSSRSSTIWARRSAWAFRHLQLLSKYVSHRAFQTEHRPVPPLTDPLVTRYPANRKVMIEANQRLVDNVTHSLKLRKITDACLFQFARTVKKGSVRFNVATQPGLPPSVLTRRFSHIQNPARGLR